jgi:MtN3 and saliva related transmembrane protein
VLATSLAALVGLLAGCLSTYSLVPQVLKCWREGDTQAVSKRTFAARAFGQVLWGIYGFFAGSLPVLIFSTIMLTLCLAILILAIRHSSLHEARAA